MIGLAAKRDLTGGGRLAIGEIVDQQLIVVSARDVEFSAIWRQLKPKPRFFERNGLRLLSRYPVDDLDILITVSIGRDKYITSIPA
jgi:hypothetical protein